MSRQFWGECLFWATADGAAIVSTASETIIFPNVTIPANYMQDGRTFRLYAAGRYSTTGTPTLVFKVRWGGVSGTILAQSAAITGGSGITNAIWELRCILQTRANGPTGSIFAMGWVGLGSGLTSAVGSATGAPGASFMGIAASQITPAAATVDLTVDTALSLTATWGTSSASNSLTGHIYTGESLN